jgi:hypothetical protein
MSIKKREVMYMAPAGGKILIGLFVLFAASCFCLFRAPPGAAADNYGEFLHELDTGRDRPMPLDRPEFISASDAGLTLERRDAVFVVEPEVTGGRAVILPQNIMVHHEVANLEFAGRRASVIYCPLTGSVRGFRGEVNGRETSFGATGKFLNSNRLYYDRATGSEWSQILGRALIGPMADRTLESFPVVWTTWSKARETYPDARTLSGDARVGGRYARDPYGSYLEDDTYYQQGGSFFPLMNVDKRLPPKEVVTAAASGLVTLAVPNRQVAEKGVLNVDAGITSVAAFHNPELGDVGLFDRTLGGNNLTFGYKNGEIFDHETRSRWTPDGEAYQGRLKGRRLERLESFDCFWFAWVAFYPGTVIPE